MIHRYFVHAWELISGPLGYGFLYIAVYCIIRRKEWLAAWNGAVPK